MLQLKEGEINTEGIIKLSPAAIKQASACASNIASLLDASLCPSVWPPAICLTNHVTLQPGCHPEGLEGWGPRSARRSARWGLQWHVIRHGV